MAIIHRRPTVSAIRPAHAVEVFPSCTFAIITHMPCGSVWRKQLILLSLNIGYARSILPSRSRHRPIAIATSPSSPSFPLTSPEALHSRLPRLSKLEQVTATLHRRHLHRRGRSAVQELLLVIFIIDSLHVPICHSSLHELFPSSTQKLPQTTLTYVSKYTLEHIQQSKNIVP